MLNFIREDDTLYVKNFSRLDRITKNYQILQKNELNKCKCMENES